MKAKSIKKPMTGRQEKLLQQRWRLYTQSRRIGLVNNRIEQEILRTLGSDRSSSWWGYDVGDVAIRMGITCWSMSRSPLRPRQTQNNDKWWVSITEYDELFEHDKVVENSGLKKACSGSRQYHEYLEVNHDEARDQQGSDDNGCVNSSSRSTGAGEKDRRLRVHVEVPRRSATKSSTLKSCEAEIFGEESRASRGTDLVNGEQCAAAAVGIS
ncbi:unnamed protein product [Phytophthora fragariaefolia]|uniref:Unnamed protein product n=1 Tax=Phytophthora fragariaefolia TaxID=1490495 RepID=A0A9W7DBQ9_9STRA|nr:unnamed protein product [Phytophthora fragariaefolia]